MQSVCIRGVSCCWDITHLAEAGIEPRDFRAMSQLDLGALPLEGRITSRVLELWSGLLIW